MDKTANPQFSIFVGWILSFGVYFTILIIATFMLESHNEKVLRFTANKKTYLSVKLVESRVGNKKKQVIVEKIDTVDGEEYKSSEKNIRAKKSKKTQNFKKLFENIKIDDTQENSVNEKKFIRKKTLKKTVKEITKENRAKKITERLNLSVQKSMTVTQSNGKYDKFKGKISDILYSYWQETIDTVSENSAKVYIQIDNFGNFSYKIETLSYNNTFNAKLRDFLEHMRTVEFPLFTKGRVFEMGVVFKDIME